MLLPNHRGDVIMNKIKNPFNISFGEEPEKLIERNYQSSEVIDTFTSDTPTTKTLILTCPRGCGKTVLLAQVKKSISSLNN